MRPESGNYRLLMLSPLEPLRSHLGRVGLSVFVLVCTAAVNPAQAQRIENQVAVFAALDKVTARISRLEIKLGETVRFGALKVTPKLCYSRPPDQPPKTTTFVEVQESQQDGSQKKLFAGWMFAESPGLDAVEHPVYDVWLTECLLPKAPVGRPAAVAGAKGPGSVAAGAAAPQSPGGAFDDDFRRRRPPR